MLYWSLFSDINGKLYEVNIETESGSGTTEFTLAGSPFVTEMSSEDKHLYSPIKTVGATVTMVTEDLPFNIYSGSPKGTKVTLYSGDEGKIEWIGYATPCMFDMGFDNPLEELEIECVDGIAVLKDLQYQDTSHSVTTFGDVIFKCLQESGVYSSFYISDNVQLTANGTESIIERFRISQLNFFDEKDDVDLTDDDVAWSCYDVLYEICLYLGYTLFAQGDEVFIIDYDAIKNGYNTYFKYSLYGSSLRSPETVTLSYSSYIDGDSYSENGAKVSLDEVYNKITVVDDFYTYENLFPEFGDETYETNITANTDIKLDAVINDPNGDFVRRTSITDYYLGLYDTFTPTENSRESNYEIFATQSWRDRYWIVVCRFFKNDYAKFKKYNSGDFSDITDEELYLVTAFGDMIPIGVYNEVNDEYVSPINGAFYAKIYKKEISENLYNLWKNKYPDWSALSKDEREDAWIDILNQNPLAVDFTPMIVCINSPELSITGIPVSYHIGPGGYRRTGSYSPTDEEDCRLYPYMIWRSSPSVFGGLGSYLCILGTFRYHDEYYTPYPLADGGDNDHLKRKEDLKYAEQGFIWARLKWGDLYYNGDEWVTEEADFKINFWDSIMDRLDRKNKNHYDMDFDFLNTAKADFAVSEDGYYIPCPEDGNLTGEVEFTLYCNRDMWGNSRRGRWSSSNKYSRYYSYCMFITNFNIKAAYTTGLLNESLGDSDTAYTNVIDNGAVDAMDDIEFKICTFDYKNPSYSAVDYLDSNNNSTYVASTYNKALSSAETSTNGCDGISGALRLEEHYVYKLATQYEEPRIILEANLHNDDYKLYGTYTDKTLSGKTFVISEINTDYKMNLLNIKFIEKV